MIITICGSTKFKTQILEVAKELTLKGHIVLSPLVFSGSGDRITEIDKIRLDALHLQKIKMSKAIFVVNVGGYIGESTENEITAAKLLGKDIYYLKKRGRGVIPDLFSLLILLSHNRAKSIRHRT